MNIKGEDPRFAIEFLEKVVVNNDALQKKW